MIHKNTYIISLCKFLHYFSMLGIFLSKPFKEKVNEKIGKADFLSKQCQHKAISGTVTTIFSWFQFMTFGQYIFLHCICSPLRISWLLSRSRINSMYKNMLFTLCLYIMYLYRKLFTQTLSLVNSAFSRSF